MTQLFKDGKIWNEPYGKQAVSTIASPSSLKEPQQGVMSPLLGATTRTTPLFLKGGSAGDTRSTAEAVARRWPWRWTQCLQGFLRFHPHSAAAVAPR